MPTLKINDINMYYEIHGEGEPLVLIQGLGGDLVTWSYFQIPEFSKKYKVIAFDNRGVGRTDAPQSPYSIHTMVEDTAGLLDALGIEKAHMLGLSLGGRVAIEFALQYPQKVNRLILACASAYSHPWTKQVVEILIRMDREGASQETRCRYLLLLLFTLRFFEDSTRVQRAVNYMMANPYPQPAHAFVGQCAAVAEHDSRQSIGRISALTLVLAGKEDILDPPVLSEELHAGIPGSELVILEGGGHALFQEIPHKFNRAVLDFLAKPGKA
ncbi:MAG: alpha/beta fold hydrolase [Dehalococcoidia bacterium]